MLIDRSAFLYLEPKKRDDPQTFAQCGSCRLFVGDRCVIHGSYVPVDADDTCGFWVDWPTDDGKPDEKVVQQHRDELDKGIPGSVTPEESGLLDKRVQCHRCEFYRDGTCGLFERLNQALPTLFDLDTKVKPNGCCNAWTARNKVARFKVRS